MLQDDLVAYLDGECSEGQANVIEQALEQDEALRTHLAALVRQRVLLAEVCATHHAGSGVRPAIRSASVRRLRAAVRLPLRRRPLVWLAAAGVLLAVGLFLLPDLPGQSDDHLVQITTVGDGVLSFRDGRSESVHVGSTVGRGARLIVPPLTFADLRFEDGSTVTLAGDSTVVVLLTARERLRLERGSLSATVTPQPPSTVFAIATAHGLATVIGTRFTLTANAATTSLMVERGRVRLSGPTGDAGVLLAAGESAQVGNSGLVARTTATPAPLQPPMPPTTTVMIPAVTGMAVLPVDPWAGASVATDNGLGVPRELFNVSGQPFKQALRITTPSDLIADPRHTGEYALRVRIPTIAPLHQGDALLATMWLRSGDVMAAQTRLVVEDLATTPRRSCSLVLSADHDWRKIEFPFHVIADANAGTVEAQLWLGHPGQTIELAGLTLINHGPQPLRVLTPQATYAGRAPDAPWRATATARIQQHRRTQLTVRSEDAQGQPLPQAEIQVRAVAPALRFGTAVVAERLLSNDADDVRYRDELLRRFTLAVPENAMKWAERERDPTLSERAVAWLTDHHLPVRGHTLVWPQRAQVPADLREHADDPLVLNQRLERHLQNTLTAFRAQLTAWDVVNDPYSADVFLNGDGLNSLQRWFTTAQQIDPATPRFLNLYGVLDEGGADRRRQDYYERLITALLASDTPLNGLGLQCHQDRNLTPPEKLNAIIERFAKFGLPIHITEFEVDLDDEALQADYTRDALTVFASQPAVQTVLTWGFWAGDQHRPQAAMLRSDWSLKPNGQVWNDLVQGTWSGSASGTSDAQGISVLTTMRGELEITVRHAGRTTTVRHIVTADQADVTLRLAAP